MSKRPIIGVTVDSNEKDTAYESPFSYATAVEKAGGVPVLLPYRTDLALVPRYVDLIDGMLFSGGHDLDPAAWGEAYHPKTNKIDPLRERFERALMAEVERRHTPALGICLGSQLMNVYRGGSMIQFLPEHERADALEHRKGDCEPWNCHPVSIEPESTLARAIGQHQVITCNTSHKQAMSNIGRGLRVVAKAPDGIVEAVEDPSMPLWLGVQWHPERMHDEPEHLALFQLLVERASQHARR
jgi:putative glutamine amidotransferase